MDEGPMLFSTQLLISLWARAIFEECLFTWRSSYSSLWLFANMKWISFTVLVDSMNEQTNF